MFSIWDGMRLVGVNGICVMPLPPLLNALLLLDNKLFGGCDEFGGVTRIPGTFAAVA